MVAPLQRLAARAKRMQASAAHLAVERVIQVHKAWLAPVAGQGKPCLAVSAGGAAGEINCGRRCEAPSRCLCGGSGAGIVGARSPVGAWHLQACSSKQSMGRALLLKSHPQEWLEHAEAVPAERRRSWTAAGDPRYNYCSRWLAGRLPNTIGPYSALQRRGPALRDTLKAIVVLSRDMNPYRVRVARWPAAEEL